MSIVKHCAGHCTAENTAGCKIQQLERPVISLLHMLWTPKGTLRFRQCVPHGLGVCLLHGWGLGSPPSVSHHLHWVEGAAQERELALLICLSSHFLATAVGLLHRTAIGSCLLCGVTRQVHVSGVTVLPPHQCSSNLGGSSYRNICL